ncbi:hypothetical protein VTH06DRAFT_5934 [Thermothelomyces fergusii]
MPHLHMETWTMFSIKGRPVVATACDVDGVRNLLEQVGAGYTQAVRTHKIKSSKRLKGGTSRPREPRQLVDPGPQGIVSPDKKVLDDGIVPAPILGI